MIGSVVKIIGNLSGWFSPERVDKRKRRKIKRLEKELHEIFQLEASDGNKQRIGKLLADVRMLESEFTS